MIHEAEKLVAALVGAATSFSLSPGDIISKCIIGTVTGLAVWCGTSFIRFVVKRLVVRTAKKKAK